MQPGANSDGRDKQSDLPGLIVELNAVWMHGVVLRARLSGRNENDHDANFDRELR